jgi:hypothetical protein
MGLLDKPEFYFIFLTILNLFNFVDRGVIPGATDEFISFISDHIETDSPNFYLGLLQSSFIIGFCLASPVFSTLTHHYGPFHLVSIYCMTSSHSPIMHAIGRLWANCVDYCCCCLRVIILCKQLRLVAIWQSFIRRYVHIFIVISSLHSIKLLFS